MTIARQSAAPPLIGDLRKARKLSTAEIADDRDSLVTGQSEFLMETLEIVDSSNANVTVLFVSLLMREMWFPLTELSALNVRAGHERRSPDMRVIFVADSIINVTSSLFVGNSPDSNETGRARRIPGISDVKNEKIIGIIAGEEPWPG
jgi:hypothetical protein